jgi:hypothetical protein
MWLNRDLGEESLFNTISSGEIEVGVFLDSLTVKDIKLSGPGDSLLSVAEARVNNLSAWALLKATIGLGLWSDFLVNSPLELRRIQSQSQNPLIPSGTVATFSLNLLPTPEMTDEDFLDFGFRYLKLTDLDINLEASQLKLKVETLALVNFRGSTLESLTVTGFNRESPRNVFQFDQLSVRDLNPLAVYGLFGLETVNFLAYLGAAQSIELRDLLVSPEFSLAKFNWSQPEDPSRPGQNNLSIDTLVLDLEALGWASIPPSDPLLSSLIKALGPKPTANARLSFPTGSSPELMAHLDVLVKDKGQMSLALTASSSFFLTLTDARPNYLALVADFGPGSWLYNDQGLVSAWAETFRAETGQDLFSQLNFPDQALTETSALRDELLTFFNAPQSLFLRWTPPIGYPISSTKKVFQNGAQPDSDLLADQDQVNQLIQKYGPLLFNDLNLSLAVNSQPALTLKIPEMAP